MNLAIHHRGSLAAPTTGARASRPARRSRAADYVADVCLITLLAVPFLLFESPSTLPDAIVVSRAGPVAMSQPAPAMGDERPLAIDP